MTDAVLIRDTIGFQTLYNNHYWHPLDTADIVNSFRRYMTYSKERWNYIKAKKNNNLGFSNGFLVVNGEKAFPIARRLNEEEIKEIKEFIAKIERYI